MPTDWLDMLITEHVTTIVRVTTGSDLITADLSKRATGRALIGFLVYQPAVRPRFRIPLLSHFALGKLCSCETLDFVNKAANEQFTLS
jgi:hypothetical protein